MKIAILRDESARIENLFNSIEQAFQNESPQIYIFNLLNHLKSSGETFDLVITDLSVKDASREAVQEFLVQRGRYLTQAVLLIEAQKAEYKWMISQDSMAMGFQDKDHTLEQVLENLRKRMVPMSHVNFETPKEWIRWSCTQQDS